MARTFLLLILIISTVAAQMATLSGCAGGSRGTGVRFNRGAESTSLDDDDDDDDRPRSRRSW